MSTSFDFDRELTAWLDSSAPSRAPEGVLNGAIQRTSRVRPRPAWLLAERWLPMQLTMRRAAFPRTLIYIVLVLALALLLALTAVFVGNMTNRLPAPFGPARPGLITYDSGGDIYVANADGSNARRLTSGAPRAWAPSGRQMASASHSSRGYEGGNYLIRSCRPREASASPSLRHRA